MHASSLTQMCGAFALGLALTTAGLAQEQSGNGAAVTSVLDGAYTEEQATRAQEPYSENCATCHGAELNGGEGVPPLTGGLFMLHWADTSVADLFEYLHTEMPLGQPGSLSDDTYVDLAALILQANGFPAGDTELTTDTEMLEQIMIERPE